MPPGNSDLEIPGTEEALLRVVHICRCFQKQQTIRQKTEEFDYKQRFMFYKGTMDKDNRQMVK